MTAQTDWHMAAARAAADQDPPPTMSDHGTPLIGQVREDFMAEVEGLCAVPGCGKPAHHRGRHANQTSGKPPKTPRAERALSVPVPTAPSAVASNGQMVRVTLTAPLGDFLKLATIEDVEVV